MTTTPAAVRGGRPVRWTRDAIIEKIREWHGLYGEPPRAADWNPSAAKWGGQEWRIERYRAGDWPSLNAAKGAFGGSLNEAIRAAGFEPHKPGPKRAAAAPVLDSSRVVDPDARATIAALERETRALRERLAVRDRQVEQARERTAALREERDEARRAPAAPAKTVTKVVREKVVDTAALRRMERRAMKAEARADEVAARAELERRQAAEVAKALARARKEAEAAQDALAEAREDAAAAIRDCKAMEDTLAAVRAAEGRERVVVRERVVRSATDEEVADARQAVLRAERAAHEAEVRAARAERVMREQAAAITGEMRRLTPDEVRELRKGGPSGPQVVMQAMKEVIEARAKAPATLPAALTKLASAAIRWREAL